jgi:hypothetical protein
LYYVAHEHYDHQIRILFYNMIHYFKFRLEFHFCDDLLFYYSYTFANLSSKKKCDLLIDISEKYDLSRDDLKIKGIEDKDLNLSLKYLDETSPFLDYLKYNNIMR